jgi:rhamnosyltransferase
MMILSVIIPTLNTSSYLPELVRTLKAQTQFTLEIIVIDSSSTDSTEQVALAAGCQLQVISRADFDHGGTRNRAARLAAGNILVFLTQDALPQDEHFLEHLVRPIISGQASASYARQMARPDASPLERFFRQYRYPDTSSLRRLTPGDPLTVRDVAFSNAASSFSASAFWEFGGFPEGKILSEDVLLVSKLLSAGHAVAYCADAVVWHTHEYTPAQQLRRYFDTGVAYSRAGAALGTKGVGGEGLKFASAQLRFLWSERAYAWFPRAILELAMKWLGFRLGSLERFMPINLKRGLSMHKGFWK